MAVGKKIGTKSVKGNGRKKHTPTPGTVTKPLTVLNTVKNTDPVRTAQNCAVPPLPKIDTYTIPDPVIPIHSLNDIPEIVPNTEVTINGDVGSVVTPATVTRKPLTMRSGLSVIVGLVGAGIGGYLAYTGLKSMFLDKGYSKDQSNEYAMYSGVACGLLVFGVLYTMVKKTA